MNPKDHIALNEELARTGWIVPEATYACLSDYEKHFLELEFTGDNSLEYYKNRLVDLGFTGKSSVLDAGCGMGQWSIAMAQLNNHVEGADINIGRLFVAKDMAQQMSVENTRFRYGSAENSPFPDDNFDAVFCYGVFMFTQMPNSLLEFHRVLKPGGKLYLNVNSLGWYLHLLVDRGLKKRDFSMIRSALRMIAKTFLGKKNNVVVSPTRLRKMLENSGFSVTAIGPEGTITVNGSKSGEYSKYPATYYGYPAVTEVLAEKSV